MSAEWKVSDVGQFTSDTKIELTSYGVADLNAILVRPGLSWGVKGLCAYLHNEGEPVAYSDIQQWSDGSGHDQTSPDVVDDAIAIGLVRVAE